MAYNVLGNPITGKKATAIVTPLTANGAIVSNGTAINLVVKSISLDEEGSEAEAETNLFGRLITVGNTKTSLEVSAYVSGANGTGPVNASANWTIAVGDYFTANITAGLANTVGTFMLSKNSMTIDPNEVVNLDMSWASHGIMTTKNVAILTANGTA